jgi:hypothetical protein
MSFKINYNSFRSISQIGGEPDLVIKSDTAPFLVSQSYYPRGFICLTGGTLTVWVEDPTKSGWTCKRDLGTVPDGFTWVWGGICGICATDVAGNNTTVNNIIAIP